MSFNVSISLKVFHKIYDPNFLAGHVARSFSFSTVVVYGKARWLWKKQETAGREISYRHIFLPSVRTVRASLSHHNTPYNHTCLPLAKPHTHTQLLSEYNWIGLAALLVLGPDFLVFDIKSRPRYELHTVYLRWLIGNWTRQDSFFSTYKGAFYLLPLS